MRFLKTRGVDVIGSIVNTYITTAKGGPIHHAVYQFPVPPMPDGGNTIIQATDIVPNIPIQLGQPVPVIYDPTNLRLSALNFNDHIHKMDPYGPMRSIVETVVGVTWTPYLILVAVLVYQWRREKGFMQTGHAVAAKIIGQKEINTGRSRFTALTYEFTDAGGRVMKNARDNLPNEAAIARSEKNQRLMDTITDNPTVLYDPDNSEKNMLYPPSYVKCVPPF